jgi:hypothetical protein
MRYLASFQSGPLSANAPRWAQPVVFYLLVDQRIRQTDEPRYQALKYECHHRNEWEPTLNSVAADVIAYGLAAGLSVLAVLVTLIILTSGNPTANGWALLAGFVLAATGIGLALILLSSMLTPEEREPILLNLLKLVLGVLLLVAAWHQRPGRDRGEGGGGKLKALLAKLEGLTPRAAFTTGLVVAVAPKRLAISVIAALTIGTAALTTGESLALLAVYVGLISAPIWILLIGYALAGDRANRMATSSKQWVIAHAHPIAFVVSLTFGLLFTLQAAAELVT